MDALLFFAMLRHGRALAFKKKSREYFELCRVSLIPVMTEDSRKDARQWYWDNSLTDLERECRDEHIDKVKADAAQHYASPASAMALFARAHSGGKS